jgi:Fic family protein
MDSNFLIDLLPLSFDVESKAILRKTIEASQYLAELKGVAHTIPNESILINTLILQEAKDSSAVENIITTHDELFKADVLTDQIQSWETKEVISYATALRKGFELVKKHGLLTSNFICDIQQSLEGNRAGFRKLPGTVLKNDRTGQVIYTPPQDHETIVRLMSNLEKYINENEPDDPSILVKMAIIHYQFESIHPFYDGNGRTGRIINILHLTMNGLLDFPILYLSRYIINNKQDYYRLLQEIRTNSKWEEWILFMLEGVASTAKETIALISQIRGLMLQYKTAIRERFPRIYSKDLLETLFKHPYTKIEHLQLDLAISYDRARNYLEKLSEAGILEKQQIGKGSLYINRSLYNLFLPTQ